MMIKTKSFELAVISGGDENSSKIALVLPGRLDTKDYAHTVSHVEYFASNGYFTLSFDPPGTWDSPGGIKIYTMTNYLLAINELIEYLGNKPTVLMGHSRGGSMAMLAGPQNICVTHIVAVMSHMGPSTLKEEDVVDGIIPSYRDMPPNDVKNKKRFDLPVEYFEDAKRHDILSGLKKCGKPKLFFYGNKDITVRPDGIKRTYEQVLDPKVIHELTSEHDYRFHEEVIREVESVTGEFLESFPCFDC